MAATIYFIGAEPVPVREDAAAVQAAIGRPGKSLISFTGAAGNEVFVNRLHVAYVETEATPPKGKARNPGGTGRNKSAVARNR